MSRTQWMQALGGTALAAAYAICNIGPVAADILIVSSNAPALRPGMQIADTGMLDIPAGAKVRVLLPSGATLAINGPASRQVKDVTKGEPFVESVWAKAKEILETGGVDQSRPGATRGGSGPDVVQTSEFSWSEIAASANGAVCVDKGAQIVLLRAQGSRVSELTLIDTAGNARAKVTWKDGELRADWPASFVPRPDALYQVIATGQPLRQLRLKVIDKANTSAERALRTLIENDCRQQARAWLEAAP